MEWLETGAILVGIVLAVLRIQAVLRTDKRELKDEIRELRKELKGEMRDVRDDLKHLGGKVGALEVAVAKTEAWVAFSQHVKGGLESTPSLGAESATEPP